MKSKQLKQLVVAGALLISSESFGTNPIDSPENMSLDSESTSTTISSIPEEALKPVGYSKRIGTDIILRGTYEYMNDKDEPGGSCYQFYETTYKLSNSCFDEIKIVKLNKEIGIVLKFHNQNILDVLAKINSLNPNNSFEYNENSLELTIGGSQELERLSRIFEAQNEWITPKFYNEIATSLAEQTEESAMDCLFYEFNILSDDFTNAVLLSDFKNLFLSLGKREVFKHNACTKFLLHPDTKPWLSHEPFLEIYIGLFSLLPQLSSYARDQREIYDNIKGEITNAFFNFYLKSLKDSDDENAFKFYKKVLSFSVGKKDQRLANKAFQIFTSSCASDLSCYEGPKIIVNNESLDTIVYMSTIIRDLKKKLESGEKVDYDSDPLILCTF